MESREVAMRSEAIKTFRAGRGAAGAPAVLLALTAILLLAATPIQAKGRSGAKVVVDTGLGYTTIKGELIAVRPDSLLLLDGSGADRSIDVAQVRSVTVVKTSKAGIGGILGLLAGVGGGYLVGYTAAVASGACPDCEAPLSGFAGGFFGCFIGLGAGASLGSAAGRDVVIPLGGLSRTELTTQLKKLRKYARVSMPL
jgi:hypothetical protein